MQQVLGYSAIQTGVAFAAITFTIIVFSNVAQTLVTRLGVRRRAHHRPWCWTRCALALFTRLPVDGHYFWDMFPAFLISGIGLAFSFVPVTIAGLTGVDRADAGIASGLINTSRQVGGAVGLAAVTTIVAAYTTSRTAGVAAVDSGLTHGFQVGFVVLAGNGPGRRSDRGPPCSSRSRRTRGRSRCSPMTTSPAIEEAA